MLVELLTPLLDDGFRRVLVLNGHGGNIDPLRVALRRLDRSYPRRDPDRGGLLGPRRRGDRRALRGAAQGDGARLRDRDVDDAPPPPRPRPPRPDPRRPRRRPRRRSRGLTWARDFGRKTDHGAVGHPERADAERGGRMLEAIVGRVAEVARGRARPAPAGLTREESAGAGVLFLSCARPLRWRDESSSSAAAPGPVARAAGGPLRRGSRCVVEPSR